MADRGRARSTCPALTASGGAEDLGAGRRARHAAVDGDLDAGDIGCVIGGEIERGLGDFVGFAHAPERAHAADAGLERRHRVFGLGHRRPDRRLRAAGRHLVDADAARRKLGGHIARHRPDRGLRRRVGRPAGGAEHGMHRTVEDDRGAVVEMRERRLHGEENRREIGADDPIELFRRRVTERCRAADAGIGEDDVEPADLCGGFRKGLFGGGCIGDVEVERHGASPEHLFGGNERFRIAAGDHDLGTLIDEGLGGRKTDAAIAASDQGNLVF
ncbi:hypothetical protein RHECNPAF_1740050 [Rhizobium etli CNPAF512]|nr:hypothetical protein RHECNPAF_1740050 [Rhizobium etli CNPAF512]